MALASQFPGLEFEYIGRLPLDGLVPDRCELVTSIQDRPADKLAPLFISPNPAEDDLWLNVTDSYPIIHDLTGRRTWCPVDREAERTRVAIGHLAAGHYTVQVVTPAGSTTGRFIKR